MGWCPECESEYVEGIMVCADCGCALVDTLPAEDRSSEADEWTEGTMSAEELLTGLASDDAFDAEDGDEEALRERLREVAAQKMADQMRSRAAGVYRNHDERAEEHRSSAYTLILVGGLGLIAVVLFFFDIIDIHMATFSKYMISGVMGVLFILFLVMGIISMKNFKMLSDKAGKENNLTREIKSWCMEHIQADQMDAALFAGEGDTVSAEIKYFKRCDQMREILNKQFMNLDEGYLERLIDEVYPDLFEA